MNVAHPPRSAEHYRAMAAQLREFAKLEPEGSDIRDKLVEVAAQYDRLAEQAQTGRAPKETATESAPLMFRK
jgi:hypothetical protein